MPTKVSMSFLRSSSTIKSTTQPSNNLNNNRGGKVYMNLNSFRNTSSCKSCSGQ